MSDDRGPDPLLTVEVVIGVGSVNPVCHPTSAGLLASVPPVVLQFLFVSF